VLLVHQRWHVRLINTASHSLSITVVIDRLLLPCHLHLLVHLGRGPGGSLISGVPIGLVTAILLLPLLTLLLIVLLIAVVALSWVINSTVPRVLAKALVEVEQVVACASVPNSNLLLCVSTVTLSSLATLVVRGALISDRRCSIILHIWDAS
jgi:hypothetical protein